MRPRAQVRTLSKELNDARSVEAALTSDVDALRQAARRSTRELHDAQTALAASSARVQELEGMLTKLHADLDLVTGDADAGAREAAEALRREQGRVAALQHR
jgi:hypothetical protein